MNLKRLARPRSKGFTLIEVMTVVAIIGVLSSLSIMGYQGVVRNARVNGEADIVAQFFKNARLRSVSTGCPHVVRYSLPTDTTQPGTLTMYRKGNCQLAGTTLPQELVTAPLDVIVNTYQTTPNMLAKPPFAGSLAGIPLYLGFTPNGLPMAAYNSGSLTQIASGATSIRFRATATQTYYRDVSVTGAGDVLAQ